MSKLFLPILALLLSVMILLTGHGIQLTVLPLLASELGWSPSLISYTGSAYFFGFMLGCLTVPRLVAKVGHIRMFAVLTSAATCALLAIALAPHLAAWMVARLVTGWSMAGLYMVIESWLNDRVDARNRGFVLSVYTVLTLVSISLGQLSLGFDLPYIHFIMLGAILITLGSIPVSLTSGSAPTPIPSVGFRVIEVYRASHVAVIGAVVGGLTTSGYWVLGPIVAEKLGLSTQQIGMFLVSALLGGALLQLPVGKLSDRIDRRLVLAGLGALGTVVAVMALIFGSSVTVLYVAMFLFGGSTFPLYSISLAHANDNSSLNLLEVGSVILLLHSGGAVIGPVLTSLLLEQSAYGLFIFSGSLLAFFCLWCFWRVRKHPVQRSHFTPFPDTPSTSHEVFEVADAQAQQASETEKGTH